MYDLIDLYKQESAAVFKAIDNASIEKFVQMILDAYNNGGKIYACGNGGNAAIVGNLVTDLNMHPFVSEDKSTPINTPRLHAINLCESGGTLTAIMNDIGPINIFSEQLKFGGKPGDLLIGITGSGTSVNIIQAITEADSMGMNTIVLTKCGLAPVAAWATHAVVIPGTSQFPGQTGKNDNTFHFEDCINKLAHIATGILKQKVNNAN